MTDKILAFIPARGGSKGIPRKNLFKINGRPLISYTLELVRELGTEVIPFISTDDEEIANYCRSEGFVVDYMRPKELATDNSPVIDAIFHGIEWLNQNQNIQIEKVMLLQATSPLRTLTATKEAMKIFRESRLESLVGVCKMKEHPYECIERNGINWSFLRKASFEVFRRQDYNHDFYFLDGSLYIATIAFLKSQKSFVKEGFTYLFETNQNYGIDIDDEEDMLFAELLIKKQQH